MIIISNHLISAKLNFLFQSPKHLLPYFRSINSCKNSKCLRNKVLKTLEYVRNFTYLSAANITSKQKSDMTKVAIENENITSFGGFYHIMDVFSKLSFEKLTESVIFRKF